MLRVFENLKINIGSMHQFECLLCQPDTEYSYYDYIKNSMHDCECTLCKEVQDKYDYNSRCHEVAHREPVHQLVK